MSEFDGFQLGVGDRELKFDSLVEGVHDFVFRRKEHLWCQNNDIDSCYGEIHFEILC